MTQELVVVDEDTIQQVEVVSRPKERFKITVFDRWCKGCGICSTFCPTEAIQADDDGRPSAVQPESCIACQLCVLRCPDMAIAVTVHEST